MRAAFILAGLLLAAGCEDTRTPPPPTAEVELAADGGYRLNGRPVGSDKLDRELARQAADAPNEKLGRTLLHVVIRFETGVPYERVLELQERCQRLGISQVEVPR